MPRPANRIERLPEEHDRYIGGGMTGGTAAVRKAQALPGRASGTGLPDD